MTKTAIKNSEDTTLERNNLKQWEFLIGEYLLTKQKKHPRFTFANDFYKCYNLKRQNFIINTIIDIVILEIIVLTGKLIIVAVII